MVPTTFLSTHFFCLVLSSTQFKFCFIFSTTKVLYNIYGFVRIKSCLSWSMYHFSRARSWVRFSLLPSHSLYLKKETYVKPFDHKLMKTKKYFARSCISFNVPSSNHAYHVSFSNLVADEFLTEELTFEGDEEIFDNMDM